MQQSEGNDCASWGAAKAQWIRLRLPFCRQSSVDSSVPTIRLPGFKSQACQLCFHHLQANLCYICQEKRTKKHKEAGSVPLKNTIMLVKFATNMPTLGGRLQSKHAYHDYQNAERHQSRNYEKVESGNMLLRNKTWAERNYQQGRFTLFLSEKLKTSILIGKFSASFSFRLFSTAF